ncbi:MAG: glycoside hydrolase family 13 protein, partial [Oscillospiraceae bacterium]|nr:glycoside hydrolase family 13 protein [Oscillospiraceae bacterium]
MYFFDESDEYFREPRGAVKTPGALKLRLKLLRGAASGARVCVWLDGEASRDASMFYAEAAGAYDVYECALEFDTPGLYWYNLKIDTPDGATHEVRERDGRDFQVTAYEPGDTTPDWIQGGVIYHIFVDRFRRGGDTNIRPGAIFREDWDGCPYYLPDEKGIVKNNDFFGGDLYGVIEKLPYLEQLGVTCVYLSPVFEASSNHKYDTGDFMKIDLAFGGDKAFEELCAKAGERGIKIILDGVFNHVGADSRYFNKYGAYEGLGAYQGEQSRWRDWFTFRENGKYDSWWGIELLPAVKKDNEDYRDFICGEEGVIAHWTNKGVSGWRFDVVDELPDVFLYPLCKAIKREKSDALIIGEVWEDASNKISY